MASRPRLRAAFGLIGVVAGVGLLVAAAPVWAARGAYANAPDCPGDRARDCVAALPATVLGASRSQGKGPAAYYVTLRIEGDPTLDEVELLDRRFYEALAAGDPVRVRVWRDRVTRLEAAGLGETMTGEAPGVESVELTLLGLFAATVGGLGVWSGVAEWFGRGEEDRGAGWRLLVALGVASGVEMFHVQVFDVYALPSVALAGAAVGVTTLLVLRRYGDRR